MRLQFQRHLGRLLRGRKTPAGGGGPRLQALAAGAAPSVPPEFNHRDYVIYLLHRTRTSSMP